MYSPTSAGVAITASAGVKYTGARAVYTWSSIIGSSWCHVEIGWCWRGALQTSGAGATYDATGTGAMCSTTGAVAAYKTCCHEEDCRRSRDVLHHCAVVVVTAVAGAAYDTAGTGVMYSTTGALETVGAGVLYSTTGAGAMCSITGAGAMYSMAGAGAMYSITVAGAMYCSIGAGAMYCSIGPGAMYCSIGAGAMYSTTYAGAMYSTTYAGAMYSWPDQPNFKSTTLCGRRREVSTLLSRCLFPSWPHGQTQANNTAGSKTGSVDTPFSLV